MVTVNHQGATGSGGADEKRDHVTCLSFSSLIFTNQDTNRRTYKCLVPRILPFLLTPYPRYRVRPVPLGIELEPSLLDSHVVVLEVVDSLQRAAAVIKQMGYAREQAPKSPQSLHDNQPCFRHRLQPFEIAFGESEFDD